MNKKGQRNKEKMNKKTYHRFGMDDKTWEKIKPHVTNYPGQYRSIAKDNRKFINAVVWILKT